MSPDPLLLQLATTQGCTIRCRISCTTEMLLWVLLPVLLPSSFSFSSSGACVTLLDAWMRVVAVLTTPGTRELVPLNTYISHA